MDSITQGLLAATIAEAGFRGKLGGRAVAFGAVVGIAPDFDMIAALGGEWSTMLHHRGMSHSWVMETLAAPLIGWLAWRFLAKRKGSWWSWAHLTWWMLVTHPALDLCTVYGTQLLAPISDHRFAIDAVFIVDPFYTVPLLVAGVMAWRHKDRRRSRRVAITALFISTSYLAVGWAQSQSAIDDANEQLAAQGFESVETRALPTLANFIVHRIIARDREGHFRFAMHGPSAPTPLEWHSFENDDDPLVEVARESEHGRLVRWFAMGFAVFELQPRDDGFTVRERDLRYTSYVDPSRSFMGVDFVFDRDGELVDEHRWREVGNLDYGAELAAMAQYF